MSHPNKNNRIANQIKRALGITSDSNTSRSNSSTFSQSDRSMSASNRSASPTSSSSSSSHSLTVSRATTTESFLQSRANAAAASNRSNRITASGAQIPQHPPPPPPPPAKGPESLSPKQTNLITSKQLKSEIASLFECPVCFELVVPPIIQCENGHIVCGDCRPQITHCPTCRACMSNNIRNLQLEKLASQVALPCRHHVQGCTESVVFGRQRLEHEEACAFRPFLCPCPSGSSCTWSGNLPEVMSHLLTTHKNITTLEGEDIVFLATDINLRGAIDWVMIQACFQQHFMLILEKQERHENYNQFFAVVIMVGSRKDCEKFIYRLELVNDKRRILWESNPQPMSQGIRHAIDASDCLVFDANMAQLFSDNGNLAINVTILSSSPKD